MEHIKNLSETAPKSKNTQTGSLTIGPVPMSLKILPNIGTSASTLTKTMPVGPWLWLQPC